MHFPHFTTLALFIFQLEKATSLTTQKPESPYDYGKIISPLAVQNLNVNLENLFVYQGTYSIAYQFDIGKLLTTVESVILELLTPEVCKRSQMFIYFCVSLKGGAHAMQNELAEPVAEMKALNSKSNASDLRIPHPPAVLSNKMHASGTSKSLETILQEDEHYNEQVRESAENGIEEIMERGGEPPKGDVMAMYSETLRILWPQQKNRIALFGDTLAACRKYNLPIRFVNKDALENDVNELRRKLDGSGFEVTIPVEKMTELALTDCFVTSDYLLQVTVNVPLRQSGNWSFQTVKPIPFMFKDEKCSIYQDETNNGTVVASVSSKYLIIRELDYNKIVGGIYVVSQNESDTQQKYSCLFALLNNHSISKLKYACPFSCGNNNASSVSITLLGRSKYVVSGGNYINITCEAGEKYLTFPDYGSLEVDMGICKCQITFYGSNDTIILKSPRRSCDPQRVGFPEMVHVIPSQWMNESAINEQPRLNSLKEIFNVNWRESWQLSEEERMEESEKEIVNVPEQIPAEEPWEQWVIILLIILAIIFLISVLSFTMFCVISAARKSGRPPLCRAQVVNQQESIEL